jgi:hypothetical protein
MEWSYKLFVDTGPILLGSLTGLANQTTAHSHLARSPYSVRKFARSASFTTRQRLCGRCQHRLHKAFSIVCWRPYFATSSTSRADSPVASLTSHSAWLCKPHGQNASKHQSRRPWEHRTFWGSSGGGAVLSPKPTRFSQSTSHCKFFCHRVQDRCLVLSSTTEGGARKRTKTPTTFLSSVSFSFSFDFGWLVLEPLWARKLLVSLCLLF